MYRIEAHPLRAYIRFTVLEVGKEDLEVAKRLFLASSHLYQEAWIRAPDGKETLLWRNEAHFRREAEQKKAYDEEVAAYRAEKEAEDRRLGILRDKLRRLRRAKGNSCFKVTHVPRLEIFKCEGGLHEDELGFVSSGRRCTSCHGDTFDESDVDEYEFDEEEEETIRGYSSLY